MKTNLFFAALLVLGISIVSCKDMNNDKENAQSKLNIKLTDAPADYDAVNVDVQKVLVNAGDDENSGWIEIETIPGVYNLLDYTAGKSTLIATAPLNVPQIKQIRIILGDNNTVVVDGIEHHLDTPSAQQSGLKLKVSQTLAEGVEYTAVLDFDASKSVVSAGQSGKYILKPVIKVYFEANTGSIKGSVEPASEKVLAEVPLSSTDTISTYSDTVTGIFLLGGLPSGTYNVIVSPLSGSVYQQDTIEGVVVTTGQTTLLEKIVLKPK
jgi:hypothetical protein